MPDGIARKQVGTTLGTHVNFYVDTILTDPGFNAENVSATPPDLAPVMSRSYVAQLCRAVMSRSYVAQ